MSATTDGLDAVRQAALADREAQEMADRTRGAARRHLEVAIRGARRRKVPLRAIAEASGLSHQRVHQIVADDD